MVFLYSHGEFTIIDDPLSTGGTELMGINSKGEIVGEYIDSTGFHAFVAQPTSTAHNAFAFVDDIRLKSPIGDRETPRLQAAWDAARRSGVGPPPLLRDAGCCRTCRVAVDEVEQWFGGDCGVVEVVRLESAKWRTNPALSRYSKPPPLGGGVFTRSVMRVEECPADKYRQILALCPAAITLSVRYGSPVIANPALMNYRRLRN